MKWMIGCISEALTIDELTIEQEFRNPDTYDRIAATFEVGGPRKILVAIKQPVGKPEVDTKNNDTKAPPQILVSDGGNIAMAGSKICYFVKTSDSTVNTDVSSDQNFIFGELSKNMLQSVNTSLGKLYQPMFEAKSAWGQADESQTQEFSGVMNNFLSELTDSMRAITKGVDLSKPDTKTYNLDERPLTNKTLAYGVKILKSWCNTIDTILEQETSSPAGSNSSANQQEAGPMTELDFWKRRQQKLLSIIEQLKTKECRSILAMVAGTVKSANPELTAAGDAIALLRRWKQIDINLTEAANETKDNVKYLFTLEKFIEPLYDGTPSTVVDTLPALMNSIKMIHTIARYYNTTDRMTNLFRKITNQMITNCRTHINKSGASARMWDMEPTDLVERLEGCLKLNEAYQEQYRLTKDKLMTTPKGKQFDFSDQAIFGKFDLFCRRLIKLIDMFSTIHQFRALAAHKVDGMEGLTQEFTRIITSFRAKAHDLLAYDNNKFDRDYVEFNVQISELETSLQEFINASFDSITDIEQSLTLLKRFQQILQRERLKSDLDSKFNVIFQNYGLELEKIQKLYEKHKHAPPIPRNLPPVAGNITWSRHLLKRIEEPMKKFETNQNVLASRDAKRIIRMYNKVARTLVAFEYLWYQAWTQSIETAKAGLQATLIIRHPDDGNLYVNFDQEILQLIREAKCLDRMGVDIPESAKIVLLQEEKFKSYYGDLHYLLKEYDRIMTRILPQTSDLLRPHGNDLEYKLRPGMVTLTWTSMNIDAYKHHFQNGLQKLEELVINMNDIIDNRIEKNLRTISKMQLVDLPSETIELEVFVKMQEKHVMNQAGVLQGKNVEIETAVADIIRLAVSYPLDPHIEPINESTKQAVKAYYNRTMYRAMLTTTKSSLVSMKKRIKGGSGQLFSLAGQKPFFELHIELAVPNVSVDPSLQDVQKAISKASKAVLTIAKGVYDWDQDGIPMKERVTFFESITKDIEIVRTVLLLTGSMQGLKNDVKRYLDQFYKYEWLWKDDMALAYKSFLSKKPTIDDYENCLKRFENVDAEVKAQASIMVIGALRLTTKGIKYNLAQEASAWKIQFSGNLKKTAQEQMSKIMGYIKSTVSKLNRKIEPKDLDGLRFLMDLLKEIRDRESSIELEMSPVLDMYRMLSFFLPDGFISNEEMDMRSTMRSSWTKMVDNAEEVQDELNEKQRGFQTDLLNDIRLFGEEVVAFRADYEANGPMVVGITPEEATSRLQKSQKLYELIERKNQRYAGGEELFALKKTEYPTLVKTKKELELLQKLYGLYADVTDTVELWYQVLWSEAESQIETMTDKLDGLEGRSMKMPRKLREWPAYKTLNKTIQDFKTVLPLLVSLSQPSVEARHWAAVMKVTGTKFDVTGSEFTLQTLLEAGIAQCAEDIEEICESAQKQLGIKNKMNDIKNRWSIENFEFGNWKTRDVPVLTKVVPVLEELEEAQMNCQTMLTMRHVDPFKDPITMLLTTLSDTYETAERWLKVQLLWSSLESVFLGGDIAKQLPREAKQFVKIDKEFIKIQKKAADLVNIVGCCGDELLRTTLPVMIEALEKCQKALDGYLEQKRNKFPRFYFVSNPVLLQVLSQGSDPEAMQPFYEKVFDAISSVIHNEEDKAMIEGMINRKGNQQEIVPFNKPVHAKGNIEDWLGVLVAEMRSTLKDVTRNCAYSVDDMGDSVSDLEDFVNKFQGQFALLGIQIWWTMDIEDALEAASSSGGGSGKKNAVRDALDKSKLILETMSHWTLDGSLTKMARTKIETNITIQVHQRDVAQEIQSLHKRRLLQDASSFDWQKQARFYWNDEGEEDIVDDNGCQYIRVADVEFQYQYEYLGVKDRLAITPLTDRCYVTLSQALGMCFGGAPAGRAGTGNTETVKDMGRTETVKDMGRTLGLWVCVTNCTDQQRYTDCAKIFKGLCQGGMWGCFDEFNRIRLPVLSVVAQQVLAIQNAKKSKASHFSFPGEDDPIMLNASCGFFITMNPGYAGRQELPENLKALFRGVAMMVPDFEIIMKVKLCAVGYLEFAVLAKKFATLYQLCNEQLSKQKHYDFGLRNILSVLRTAGQNKRDDGGKSSEKELLYRTLRDMNLSKFVAQDVPLFLSLLADLFPKLSAPADSSYPEMENCISNAIVKKGLVEHKHWVKKIIQLYETTLVRHGIM